MKIVYLLLISSLLSSCHILKPSKQDRLNQFQPSEKTYQASVGSTTLSGIVTESETNEGLIYGTVVLYQNGVLVKGTETDFDGKYLFSELKAGVYDLEISYVGYKTIRITGIEVKENFNTLVNGKLKEGIVYHYCGYGYEIPLVEQDNTTSGQTLTSDQIRRRRSSN